MISYLGEVHSAHEGDSSITVSYTAPAGTNYCVIMAFANCTTGPQGSSAVTYDGNSATYISGAYQYDASDYAVKMWGYARPVVGSAKNVIVTFTGTADNFVVIISLGGINLTTPYHDGLGANGSASVSAVGVKVGELAIGMASLDATGSVTSSASSPQTQVYGETAGAWGTAATAGYQAGTGVNITLSYTGTPSYSRIASCCAVFSPVAVGAWTPRAFYDTTQIISSVGAISSQEALGSDNSLQLCTSLMGNIASLEAFGIPGTTLSFQNLIDVGYITSGEGFGWTHFWDMSIDMEEIVATVVKVSALPSTTIDLQEG